MSHFLWEAKRLKKVNPIMIVGGILLIAIIIIPSILVLPFASGKTDSTTGGSAVLEENKDWNKIIRRSFYD